MSIDNLLSKLEKVKPNGQGKWLACCPAHNDKSPSLGVKLTEDAKILIHCFAGCDVESIVSGIGLSLADLMPESVSYKKGAKPPRFNKYELFDRLAFETVILTLALRRMINGATLSVDDLIRVLQAESTINDIVRECRR